MGCKIGGSGGGVFFLWRLKNLFKLNNHLNRHFIFCNDDPLHDVADII